MTFASALTFGTEVFPANSGGGGGGVPEDDFERTVATGLGTGGLGTWVSFDPSHDQYESVSGGAAIFDETAPLAVGDLTAFVPYDLGPISAGVEVLFEFSQVLGSYDIGHNPFIDFVFYLAASLTGDHITPSDNYVAFEVANSPSSQTATLTAFPAIAGPSEPAWASSEGGFAMTYGTATHWMFRFRADSTGIYARIWDKATAEPSTWTAFASFDSGFDIDPQFIVIQPRQATHQTGQVFYLWDIQIPTAGATCMTDQFDRVLGSSWGTSDAGITWQINDGTGLTFSTDGSHGIAQNTDTASGSGDIGLLIGGTAIDVRLTLDGFPTAGGSFYLNLAFPGVSADTYLALNDGDQIRVSDLIVVRDGVLLGCS